MAFFDIFITLTHCFLDINTFFTVFVMLIWEKKAFCKVSFFSLQLTPLSEERCPGGGAMGGLEGAMAPRRKGKNDFSIHSTLLTVF